MNSLVIVEQTPRSMGLGGRLSDEIQERFFNYLDCPVGKVSAPDIPIRVAPACQPACGSEVDIPPSGPKSVRRAGVCTADRWVKEANLSIVL